MTNVIELWQDVANYDGKYKISNFGRLKSIKSKLPIIMKPSIDSSGYYSTMLCMPGRKHKTFAIHRLVWDHFGNQVRDNKKHHIDHIDENKLNNHISNLQLLTSRQNIAKSRKRPDLPTGVAKNGKKFYAKAMVNKRQKYLGTFTTIESAYTAYLKATS